MSILSTVINRGTRSAQPLATAVSTGTLYGVTDEGNIIERSNGTTWDSYSPSGGGIATATTGNSVISAGLGVVASQSLEVGGGFSYEIGSGSRLEITGDEAQDLGSIVMSFDGFPTGTLNLSTLGTIDWFFTNGSGNTPPITVAMHSKANGGWLYRGFDYISNTGTAIGTITAMPNTITTTGGDDALLPFSSTPTGTGPSLAAGALMGFKIRVPTSAAKQVLHLFLGQFQNTTVITAKIQGSVFPTQTLTTSVLPANATARYDHIKIAYTGNGNDLIVTCLGQNTSGSGGVSPRVGMMFAYISTT